MASCPECDAELKIDADDLENLEVGEPWTCPGCASHLRIVNLDPLDFDTDDELDEDIRRDDNLTGASDDDSDDDEEEWED